MPIYQYHCKKCNKEVEELKSFKLMDEIPACDCPPGESEMKRVIFTSGLNMKGKGWYSGGFHNVSSRSKK